MTHDNIAYVIVQDECYTHSVAPVHQRGHVSTIDICSRHRLVRARNALFSRILSSNRFTALPTVLYSRTPGFLTDLCQRQAAMQPRKIQYEISSRVAVPAAELLPLSALFLSLLSQLFAENQSIWR